MRDVSDGPQGLSLGHGGNGRGRVAIPLWERCARPADVSIPATTRGQSLIVRRGHG